MDITNVTTSDEMTTSQEYLSELIPYRCPKCGNSRRFPTLRELRQHLQTDHAYKMSFVRPQTRTKVFDSKAMSSRTSSFNSVGSASSSNRQGVEQVFNSKYKVNQNNYSRSQSRESSPLLQSFKDETVQLEKQLLAAKQSELRHKTMSMESLAQSTVGYEYKARLQDIGQKTNFEPKKKQRTNSLLQHQETQQVCHSGFDYHTAPQGISSVVTPIPAPRAKAAAPTPFSVGEGLQMVTDNPLLPIHDTIGDNPMGSSRTGYSMPTGMDIQPHPTYDTRDAVHIPQTDYTTRPPNDGLRLDHWATTGSLYETQDFMAQLEEEAANKCRQQRDIIEQLVQDMRTKDLHLKASVGEQEHLRGERERLLSETEGLMRRAGEYSSNVRQELDSRDNALAGVNRELGKLKELSEKEIKAREKDAKQAREQVVRLERQRDKLIQETETLLHKADINSTQLRHIVKEKETELLRVNQALKDIRSDQEAMLEKTMTVYRSAEESRHVMKVAMDTKEDQLHEAMQQIDGMSALHERLVEQSRILTEQADENTTSMQRMLNVKVDQIQDLSRQLDTLKTEKQQLEENSSMLAEKADSSSSVVESLRGMVSAKEHELRTTQSELQDLKIFLKKASDKERVARDTLEIFIEDLIRRAEKAESELHVLKSQSATTITTTRNDSTADIHTSLLNKIETSERQSLPTKITPIKPHRTKLRANSQTSETVPEWRSRVPRVPKRHSQHSSKSDVTPSRLTVEAGVNTSSDIKHTSDYSESLPSEEFNTHDAVMMLNEEHTQKQATKHRNTTRIEAEIHKHSSYTKQETHTDDMRRHVRKNRKSKRRRSLALSDRTRRLQNDTRRNKHNHGNQYTDGSSDSSEIFSDTALEFGNNDKANKSLSTRRRNASYTNLKMGYNDNNGGSENFRKSKSTNHLNNLQRIEAQLHHDDMNNKSNVRGKITQKRRPTSVGLSHNDKESDGLNTVNNEPSYNIQTHQSLSQSDPNLLAPDDGILDEQERYSSTRKLRTRSNEPMRRSKSHSPRPSRMRRRRLPSSSAEDQSDEESDNTAEFEVKEGPSSKYDHYKNPEEDEDIRIGDLDNLMDENGILWDDMDTLPNVSDSELDRVSPSGSEAIATKNTSTAIKQQPVHHGTSVIGHIGTQITVANVHQVDVGNINSRFATSPKVKPAKTDVSLNKILQNVDMPETRLKSPTIVPSRASSPKADRLVSQTVLFKPIRTSPGTRASISDKDISSGGREVHQYMSVSPVVRVQGSSVTDTNTHGSSSKTDSSRYRSNSSTSRTINGTASINEPLSDKIKRISDKYTQRHSAKTDIADSKFKDNTFIDGKIQAINEKYKQRRGNILEGKGLDTVSAPLELYKYTKRSPRTQTSILDRDTVHGGPRLSSSGRITAPVSQYMGTGVQTCGYSSMGAGPDLAHRGLTTFGVTPYQTQSHFMNYPYPPYAHQAGYGYPQFSDLHHGHLHPNIRPQHMSMPLQHSPNYYGNVDLSHTSGVMPHTDGLETRGNMQHSHHGAGGMLAGNLDESDKEQVIATQTHVVNTTKHVSMSNSCKPSLDENAGQINKSIKNQTATKRMETYSKFAMAESDIDTGTVGPLTKLEINIPTAESKHKPIDAHWETFSDSISSTTSKKANENKWPASDHSGSISRRDDQPNGFTNESDKGQQKQPNVQTMATVVSKPNSKFIMKENETNESFSEHNIPSMNQKEGSNSPRQDTSHRSSENRATTRDKHINDGYQRFDDSESDRDIDLSFSKELNEHLDLTLKTPVSDIRVIQGTDATADIEPGTGTVTDVPLNEHNTKRSVHQTNATMSQHLPMFEDVDNSENVSLSIGNPSTSAFASEIDDLSIGCDSTSMSYIGLPTGNGTLTDTDMDTDMVRRELYESAGRIKELIDDPDVMDTDYTDVYNHKLSRNTTSSASSQASFEVLERVPAGRREETRRRRAALACIFSFLDIQSLCTVSQVCREWTLVSRSSKLWTVLQLTNVKVSEHFLKYLSKRCSKLRILKLEDLEPRDKREGETEEDFQETIRSAMETGYERVMKKAESSLHTVSIVNCGTLFSAKCLWIASCCCRKLRHVTYLTNNDPVNTEVMWALGSGCRDMRTLRIHPLLPCSKIELFSTRCVQLIGKCFQDLKRLSIGGKHIDVSALGFIAKRCPKLQEIELHNMPFVSAELVDDCCQNGFRALESLRCIGTPIAPGALMLLKEYCSQLRYVQITMKQSDHLGEVTLGGVPLPEYDELVEGYQQLEKQAMLVNILHIDVSPPEQRDPPKVEEQEKSFFQKLFG